MARGPGADAVKIPHTGDHLTSWSILIIAPMPLHSTTALKQCTLLLQSHNLQIHIHILFHIHLPIHLPIHLHLPRIHMLQFDGEQGLTRHSPMAHPIMARYLYYSRLRLQTMAEMFVLVGWFERWQGTFVTLSQGGLQLQWRALQDILNDSFICYQDLSECLGLTILNEGFMVNQH